MQHHGHNARIAQHKSPQALELLRELGVEPAVVEYLEAPRRADEVKPLVAMLKVAPHELLRSKEEPWSQMYALWLSRAREAARFVRDPTNVATDGARARDGETGVPARFGPHSGRL